MKNARVAGSAKNDVPSRSLTRHGLPVHSSYADTIMLTITHAAWARLAELAAAHPDVLEWRLIRRDGRIKCRRAVRRNGDHTFQESGRPVLLMSSKLASRLSHKVLDAPDTQRGPRLQLRHPSGLATLKNEHL